MGINDITLLCRLISRAYVCKGTTFLCFVGNVICDSVAKMEENNFNTMMKLDIEFV